MNARYLFLLLILPLALLAISCGEDEPPMVHVNQPPTVELTSGPVDGGVSLYSIEIGWIGNDPDGMIARYEYVVDPPAEFTEEEIAIGGPGITSVELKDLDGVTEVTRVSKEVNGQTVSFDWIHTGDTSRNFTFSTSEPESTTADGQPVPTGRFTGMHAVYVRAVDDEGAVSEPDKVAFTAETVAPTTTITRPGISGGPLNLGLEARVEWTGEDPDGVGSLEPVAYRYALLRLDTQDPAIPLLFALPEHLFSRVPEENWVQIEALNELTFEIENGGQYLFGIRAMDEAGAVEPFLELGRNVFKFQSLSGGGLPTLTVNSYLLGSFHSQGEVSSFDVEIPTQVDLQLELLCNADAYGESCTEYRWGFNLFGPESPPWVEGPVSPSVKFTSPGTHVLYVQARDALKNVTTMTFLVNAVQFQRDRQVLLIDDYKDSSYPTDEQHDAFWSDLFNSYPAGLDWYEWNAVGDASPSVPSLSELGRYRMAVWDNAVGYAGQSGLLSASTLHPVLRAYLAGGGKLWVNGLLTPTAMVPSPNGVGADLNYPKEDLGAGQFAWDFMKLRTGRINREAGATIKNFLSGVDPHPQGSGPYAAMSVDQTKLHQPFQVALSHCDAIFLPLEIDPEDGFVGELEPVYAYRAYGDEFQDIASSYNGKITGFRWHDPASSPSQGRVQWFGFPMYYMQDAQAQDTFNKSIDWLKAGP